jgi:hypothetical protein
MTGLEIVALIPMAYGALHLANKVVDLRETINNQTERISELESAMKSSANGSSGSGGPGSPSSMGRLATFGGVAAASGLVAYNTWRLWSRSAAVPPTRHGPPENYEPVPSTNEDDQCRVCWEHRRDTLVGPCNHLALCWTCASCIVDTAAEDRRRPAGDTSMGQCPLCRGPIRELRFAFM